MGTLRQDLRYALRALARSPSHAALILFTLAVTSVNAAVRWLGGKKWKNLHRLAYIAAALVAYHQAAARQIFPMQVVWIFAPLILLEIARIVKQRTKTRSG